MRFPIVSLLGLALLVAVGCTVDKDAPSGSATVSSTAGTTAKPIPPDDKTTGFPLTKDDLSAKSDIPLYPASDVPDGKSNVTTQGKETRYELTMITLDKPDKVADYYKSKMKVDKSGSGNQIDMLGNTPKGNLAQITITAKDGKTTIKAVSLVEGK